MVRVGGVGREEVPFINTGLKYLIGGEVAKCPLCVCGGGGGESSGMCVCVRACACTEKLTLLACRYTKSLH